MGLPIVHPAPANSPFPGARSIVEHPLSGDWYQIPAWGKTGHLTLGPPIFQDAFQDFQAAGITPADVLFICDSDTHETDVFDVQAVPDPITLQLFGWSTHELTNCWYKVGRGDPHTWATLMDQMNAAGPYSAMWRWGKMWSNALPSYYNTHEDGLLINIVVPLP